MNVIEIGLKTIIVISLLAIGWIGNNIYQYYYSPIPKYYLDNPNQVKVNGIWTNDIKQIANYSGTFICINIKERDTLKDMMETCQHEIGHEVFARECGKNFTICEEVSK
jgi:hypothetical protein